MPPNATLATRFTSGTKCDKSRITIFLAYNATDSIKLQSLIIGKAAKPLLRETHQAIARIASEKTPDSG
ncbi:hypothetical protein G9A89_015112 [Geosiphon pyriformis]|nr:hypothetical protein G9A89_015112 [Geosiphon pyriformis]